MEFKDKIVLITGAASGIGHATAKLYGAEGATVVVSDVNERGGHETVRQITEGGGTAAFIKANVTEYEEVQNLITSIARQFGRLDIAINNANIAVKPKYRRSYVRGLASSHRRQPNGGFLLHEA